MASRRTRIVCQCGGELQRPVPRQCPHCGARIVQVKRSRFQRLWPWFVVGLMFGALAAFLRWMSR